MERKKTIGQSRTETCEDDIKLLLRAVRDGDLPVTKRLLAKGTDVNEHWKGGWNSLLMAIKRDHEQLVRLLLEHGADPNCRVGANVDIDGTLPAIALAAHGNVRIVQALLEAGADINAESEPGNNALLAACCSKNEPVANLLLDHGARLPKGGEDRILSSLVVLGSISLMDRFAKLGLDWKAKGGILAFAAKRGQFVVMDYLLGVGVDINVINEGLGFGELLDMTPLMTAVYEKREDVVQYLLERGADPSIKVAGGKRDAIYWAKKRRQTRLLRILQNALRERQGNSRNARSTKSDRSKPAKQ